MNMFINFNVNTGIKISSYRNPNAYAGDIGDLAVAVTNGNENVCCDLEGAKYALEDGGYWQGSDVTQEALETIYNAICEWENQNGQNA